MYVVPSVEWTNAVDRNSKTLALNPFIAQVGKRITGHDEATSRIVQHNLNGENGPGYVTEIHDGTVASLAPGPGLEKMTTEMLGEAWPYFERLGNNGQIELYAWIKHVVTMCSTRAIYGPENPFNQHPERYVKAFWDYNKGLDYLMMDIAPKLGAPEADTGRSDLGLAFKRYFEQYKPQRSGGSMLAETRASINARYGLTTWNQGRLEVGILLGILTNTIPSIFYMLIHVLSDPDLLLSMHKELETTAVHVDEGNKIRTLKVLTMRAKCGLLHSTFQEVLRLHAMGASARYVREDTMLGNRYLLKKGMIVHMPQAVMHADATSWGSDVHKFRPDRFLKLPRAEKQKDVKPGNINYRPFGGGASLCPGRHFVTLETMVLVAVFVLRFDARPVDGRWIIPEQKQETMATNVFPPDRDVKIDVKERDGYEGWKWGFEMS